MKKRLADRYYLVLASIYLHNEYRGYRELERLLSAIKEKFPTETDFIAAVEKHTEDEQKHYLMFRHYFESSNQYPLAIGRTDGYIDRFVKIIFQTSLDDLDPAAIIADDRRFFKLCRLVMMTEFRGMKQIDSLLRSNLIRQNGELTRLFKIIQRDEPTHCYPYQLWLKSRRSEEPGVREQLADLWIHYSLVLVTFPLIYLNPFHKRLGGFPA